MVISSVRKNHYRSSNAFTLTDGYLSILSYDVILTITNFDLNRSFRRIPCDNFPVSTGAEKVLFKISEMQ